MTTIHILDGGLGTSLEDKYGVKFTHASTPLWSSHLLVADPATLAACQRDFAAAGADVLLTATYQASTEAFQRTQTAEFPHGIPQEAVGRYLRTAVDVAEAAARGARAECGNGGGPVVDLALGLGPYGAAMVPGQEFSGRYDAAHDGEEALFRWHLDRLRLFTAVPGLVERVRYLAFETLPRLDEVRAVRRSIRAAGIEKEFWVSCVFRPDDGRLPDGSTAQEVVEAMLGQLEDAADPWGIGINCTKLHQLPALIQRFEEKVEGFPSVPTLVLYPDGTNGEVYNTTTQVWELPADRDADAAQTVSP